MKLYLNHIASQLKNYSKSLEKTSILIDKPWALIDDEYEMQKLIFKKNRELVLSVNGKVTEGRWEYFPEAKSLLIDRGSDKILCNEAFIDHAVMVLKLDGTENRFFILANENFIPDLNAAAYLKELRFKKLNIIESKAIDGTMLEVQVHEDWKTPIPGGLVTVDAEPVKDGLYELEDYDRLYQVAGGRIKKIITEKVYINPDGQEVLIHQQKSWTLSKGDKVFLEGSQTDDGQINFSKRSYLVVKDGKLLRDESKNRFLRWLIKGWRSYSGYDE